MSPKHELRTLLSVKDISQRWGISEREIRKLIYLRKLACYRVGRLVRFDELHLQQFLQSNQQPSIERDQLIKKIMKSK